jgi:hypothetical protein
LIGITDYYSGIDFGSFTVNADFAIDGHRAGENLAPHFRRINAGVYELKLKQPFASPGKRSISVSIKDRQGNLVRIDRTFAVTEENR